MMNLKIPQEVFAAFIDHETALPDHTSGNITVESISGGLINHTFKVSCQLKPDFLLQQINKNVFDHPDQVQNNYIRIWEYAEFEFTGLRLPTPKYYGQTATLFVDDNENYWRAFEFIENARMIHVAEKPSQAKAAARSFAKFTAAFEDFNVQMLKKVIPGFHDLSLRYSQFEDAMKGEAYERMAKALPVIEELKQRERYKYFYEVITESEEFPQRVMHHDAKITNVLFSTKKGKVICPVDFDTVMPGYFFSDLGDLIRSLTSPEDENSIHFDKIEIRKEFYEAIITGYLYEMEKQLTTSEIKYIHYSGLLIIYMQALRFLTDYLNGDVYYRIDYPNQNFNRAKNQLILLQKLEEFLFARYNIKYE
jgi:thiamine kinase-like enzyme